MAAATAAAPRSRRPIVRAVERAIKAHLPPLQGETLVVAVSGGADSVFLLLSLHALAAHLELRLHVAHLDHGWRGVESAADASFVAALAARLGLPYTGGAADTPGLARTARLSPEDAARQARYAFLRDTCRAAGARVLATGHTQDDRLETALMALLRGSGPAGIAAPAWVSPLPAAGAGDLLVIRPLLEHGRAAIRAVLRAWGEPWREDPTNEAGELLRSRVRRELLPLLESLAPGFRTTMLRSLELIGQTFAIAEHAAAAVGQAIFVPVADGLQGGLQTRRSALLGLEPPLRAVTLRWAAGQIQADRQDLEWAPLVAALAMIERGRGGAVARLSPRVAVRLERGWVRVLPVPGSVAGQRLTNTAGASGG